jgi:hypothetical protein
MRVFNDMADREMGILLGVGEMHRLIHGRDSANTALGFF